MHFNIISLLPEIFKSLTDYGITQKAHQKKLYTINFFNPRNYTNDIHHTVDDRPYGGGPGMLMLYQPIKDAIMDIKNQNNSTGKIIYMSPQGKTLTHQKIISLSKLSNLTILCGRYEGIDQRIIDNLVDEEISIGDYVLSGGEIPAMVLLDTIIRQIPGALGHQLSNKYDSFVDGLLDTPHYTRPETIDGLSVPKILLSGNHQAIKQWRLMQAEQKTKKIRPDLLKKISTD